MPKFQELEDQFAAIKVDAVKFENGNKAAGVRVRKGLIKLDGLSKAYRAASLKTN